MKIQLLLILIITGIAGCYVRDRQHSVSGERVSSFETIRENFSNPPVSYSTAPFWVWNDIVTTEKIDVQLKEFKDQQIHMVFIHPRPGLITEYLSREWMELVEYTVDKAAELDMKIWLYDENSYPSGFAGGHVPAMMPESYNRGAGLELTKLNRLTREDSGTYYLLLKRIGNRFANITNGIHHEYNKPGEYYAFSKWFYPSNDAWYGGWSYVDLLAEGVTEKFIKLTMRDYEKELGEKLGTLIPGIFTDEPNINTRGGDPDIIRWTPALFEEFEKKYGYQLQTYLPALYEDIGDYRNIRHDYYSLLLDLFIDRWAKPWFEYTENNNLLWTGHYWEHGWPNPKHGGDNMAMYAWHQVPGIDMLFNSEASRPDQFGNVRAVKELSSVANQMGRNRTLSETYGGAGWELNFEDMKRLGDWEYALGVNFMNQHLSYMTIKGARKRDFPQSMSYHTPWWDNYQVLNAYFHRLSYVLSAGQQDNRILVIEPTSSTWMYFTNAQDRGHLGAGGFLEKYQHSFHSFLEQLENYQVEYDLGSERLISEFGKTSNGKFIVGEKEYDLVVLPPLFENFEPGTFRILEQYLAEKGKVLSFGALPGRLDGNQSTRTINLAQKYKDQWMIRDSLSRELKDVFFTSEEFTLMDPEKWGGRVHHMRRRLDEGQLIFFSNFDKKETAVIEFRIQGESLVRLDPVDGKIIMVQAGNGDALLRVSCKVPPSNSVLYFAGETSLKELEPVRELDMHAEKINGRAGNIQPLSPNMLTLDYCDLTIDGRTFEGMYFYNAADTIFKYHLKEPYGFNYNPWSVAVQYRTNILDRNRFDSLSGFEVIFPFYISQNFIPENLNAVVEWPHLYRVRINGKEIEHMQGEWWLDRSFGMYKLSGLIQAGRNELQVSIRPMHILAELEPVYLLGDFSLSSEDQGWIINPPVPLELGSWKSQGFPHYSGEVAYTQYFDHNGTFSNYKVKLNSWRGSVAEIWVNDSKAGIIGWAPYELDISPRVRQGENRVVVRICGSLKNLLGPHHNDPRPGVVTPWSFFYAPESQPPGTGYHLLDYGLFEEFEILGCGNRTTLF